MIKERTIIYLTCNRCGKTLDNITSMVENEELVKDSYTCSCGTRTGLMVGQGFANEEV